MAKIAIEVPDGEYCASAGVSCCCLDWEQQGADGEVIRKFPRCKALNLDLVLVACGPGYVVKKPGQCILMEANAQGKFRHHK